MTRTLETVLIGRDLLSPVLVRTAGNLRVYDQSVTGTMTRTTGAVEGATRRQGNSLSQLGAVAALAATTQRNASATVVAARERETAAAGAVGAAEQRLAALRQSGTASGLRLALAEDNVAQATLRAQAAQRARALTQGALLTADLELTAANDRLSAANARVAGTSGQATLAMRAQSAATGALASANGLLGTSLTPLTAGLGAVALGLGYATYRGAQFDSAMSAVQAATMATGGEMENLRDLAIDLGGATQYSAEEAAQGITELAKAGVSTSDILNGGLAGALDLAAAGQLDVADAAEIAATQMTVFGLAGDQTSHVADLLAAGAGKAQGSVQDLALALQYAGVPAAGLGLSVEETTGALGLFASNGIIGEKAGTAFRGMLVSMTNPAAKARTLMDDLNISFFDAQGNFIGMEGVAGQLQSRLGDLTVEQRNAALATIFGNEAIGAAQTLYNGGAQGVRDWTRNVDDAGFAAEQAAMLTDNLGGDLERLGGAFDSAMTTIGDGTQGPLRALVQTLTSLIDAGADFVGWISDLPGPLQAAAIAIAAVYIAAGPLSGVFPAIALNARVAFALIKLEAVTAGGAMGLFTGSVTAALTALRGLALTVLPFAVVGAAIAAVAQIVHVSNAAENARESIDELTKSYDEGKGPERYNALATAIEGVRKSSADAQAELNEINDRSAWESFWSFNEWADTSDAEATIAEATDRLDELNAAAERAEQSAGVLGRRYNMTRSEVEEFADAHGIDLSGSLRIVQQDFINVADASGLAATGMSTAADGALTGYENFASYAQMLGLSDDATEDLNKSTMDLAKSMADFVDPLGAYTALIDEKKDAERTAAEATAVAAGDSASAWEDYVGDVTVSFDEYMAKLEEQVLAQQNWETNMLMLAGRVSQGTLDYLQQLGDEGAPLVADLVNRSDAELDRFDTLASQRSEEAIGAWRDQIVLATPVLANVAAVAGQGVANSLAAQLAAGTVTVAEIARQYGVAISAGVNPVLAALGNPQIQVASIFGFGALNRAEGGAVWGAGTATSDSIPAMLSNGEYVLKASSVALNGVSALDDLNEGRASVARFAAGGFASTADVPGISSTAPFGPPLSTAAQAAMTAERNAAIAFLAANTESIASAASGPAGGNAIGGGWQTIAKIVQAAIPQARINSTYRPGDPGYHGRGKAVDFGFGSGPGGAGSAGLAKIAAFLYSGYGRTLAELIYDGIGDSSPDVKNGRDHTYNAGTRAEHRNHVHAAVYANGGLVEPGSILNPHVRDTGGPLLPGYTYNGLNRPEMVLPMAAGGLVAEDGSTVGAGFYGATAGPTEATLLASAQRRIANGVALTAEQQRVVAPRLVAAASPGYGSGAGLVGLRIAGVLDLGNGLTGRIDGRIAAALTGSTQRGGYNS